jgi:CHAT domain-containing protein
LSRQVLQPLSKEILNLKRLIIIADGALQLVPFTALTFAENEFFEPLIAKMEIAGAPSIRVFSSCANTKLNGKLRPANY